ncbi:PFU-domain-containing protein [Cutaneotrichosporon oleaginosum]|uniref:PFU-domain-containing protein n=1 Tax=Cutaneotrichosporon oleaginosum TaxID=879819 RepID=A0A0J0XWA2_9TREE|nr:PFU-domain-containing protein [Cutaneotrichosporon oleaginosum]KLT45380.1 PFU-domain-containing protein [Cutaneotrichosporon oleaginosum]TXT14655.1 hypothetical protein COLE_00848 [Cutaneotrichosporon oleaginosum]
MAKPYQLAFTLHGHSSDVRAVTVADATAPHLLSASRDGSAILWGPSSNGKDWDAKLRVEELERNYVSCVTSVKWQGDDYLLIGSSKGLLSSYVIPGTVNDAPSADPPTLEPFHTLIEHQQNLCCIDATKNALVATGSWDMSVIIWKDFKKVITIKGHKQAVWAVKFVGEDRVLTASADKEIILHAIDVANGRSTPLQTYTGHTEPVRGLSLRPDGKGFWSCGNDGLVNLYSFDKPAPIRSLSGHTSFVYSVAALPDGSGAISSGEDGTLRLWSETELVQTINHPSLSLWSCTVVPQAKESGYYLVSAAADSTIRFFTRTDDLKADAETLAQWDKEVGERKLDKSQVGDVKRTDLPGMEALGREGKKDGQVIMINNNDSVEAYQWQAANSTWQQIGQVVDAVGSGRKQLYEGKEYDYVFDVDVSEGMPPLKLPYNVSENPWVAAQRFLDRNDLPGGYAEQVVDFIQKNTGGVELGTGSSNYVDPYTGATRYTGGGVTTGSGSGSAGQSGDPFTGGSRYTGGGVTPGSAGGFGGADPLTGSSSYQSTPPAPTSKILPVKTYLTFKKINAKAAQGKLEQFDEELSTSAPGLVMDNATKACLDEAVAIVAADKPAGQESYDPATLLELALRWRASHRFPLVDILRVLALYSPAFAGCAEVPKSLLSMAGWGGTGPVDKPTATNTLLGLRTLANMFNSGAGQSTMVAAAEHGILAELIKGRSWADLGNAKQPFATIALNYSITALDTKLPATQAGPLLDLIVHILKSESTDSETLYRAGVAFGNLLSSPIKGSLAVGSVKEGKQVLLTRAKGLNEKRVTELALEVNAIAA